MKRFLPWLHSLYSATAIGLYVTAGFIAIASSYFTQQGRHSEQMGPIEQLLTTAHQKSVDYRLKQRGERSGSNRIGLLTVDEKAVSTIGRWPWPREVTARAIDNAIKLGARVLAFDMVFAEPSAHPLKEAISDLSRRMAIPKDLAAELSNEIQRRDGDAALAEVLARHYDRLVLGSFGETTSQAPAQETFDYCFDLVFQLRPEAELWTTREQSGIIVKNALPELPETIKGLYLERLKGIAEAVRERHETSQAIDIYQLNNDILQEQMNSCTTFLDPERDETFQAMRDIWPQLLEAEDARFREKFPTAEAWLEFIRSVSARNAVPLVPQWTMNIPDLLKAHDSFNTGYFIAVQDPDGTIRRTSLFLRSGNTYMPSIALKAYLLAHGYNAQLEFRYNAVTRQREISRAEVLNDEGDPIFSIPVDPAGRLPINYSGRQKIFPYVSLADLLTERDDLTYTIREKQKDGTWQEREHTAKKAEFMKDRIFVVGATAVGIYDLRVTPFEENYPGAETHLTVLDNLLRRDFLTTAPWEEQAMLAGLAILGAFLSYVLAHLGALPGLTIAAAMFFGIAGIDRYFWFGKGIVVTIILPLALILTLFIVLISYRYLTEERRKKELRATFAKYVSPAIVEEILSDPSKIELGGRKARVTVFFSDVRGFTTISEKLDPRALSDLLNQYLTPMTDLIFSSRGTLDKYMGDAIMAFFGAPIPHPEHAKDACRCALLHIQKLKELQAEFHSRGLPEIDIGIGLNTGEVSVGNMGSQTVRSYTVMGDAVNLASRLEGINKQYGTRIIISEFTFLDVRDSFTCREIDRVRVKGKAQPVKIFELVAEGRLVDEKAEILKRFAAGYTLYHQRQFAQARACFEDALRLNPEDGPSQLYVERCEEFLTTPPPNDWDGVYVMKTK